MIHLLRSYCFRKLLNCKKISSLAGINVFFVKSASYIRQRELTTCADRRAETNDSISKRCLSLITLQRGFSVAVKVYNYRAEAFLFDLFSSLRSLTKPDFIDQALTAFSREEDFYNFIYTERDVNTDIESATTYIIGSGNRSYCLTGYVNDLLVTTSQKIIFCSEITRYWSGNWTGRTCENTQYVPSM